MDDAMEFLVQAHATNKHISFASEIVSALLNEQLKNTNIVVSLTEKPKNANKNKRKNQTIIPINFVTVNINQ